MLFYDAIICYRTKDNTCTTQFGMAQFNDHWRAYILTPLNYLGWGRSDAPQITGRTYDQANGLFYIHWHLPVVTAEMCEAVAVLWSDLTMAYLHTGETIGEQYERLYYSGQSRET